jgi:hypothetical protein
MYVAWFLHFKLTFCSSFPSLGCKQETETGAQRGYQEFGRDMLERQEETQRAQRGTGNTVRSMKVSAAYIYFIALLLGAVIFLFI